MYTENLPKEFQPEDRTLVPTVDPKTRAQWHEFLQGVEDGKPVNILWKQVGISAETYCEWLCHPEFKYKITRVRELRKEVIDDTIYAVGLNPRNGHEDRKLWAKAHHPAYQSDKQSSVKLEIHIDPEALAKSRTRQQRVNDSVRTSTT